MSHEDSRITRRIFTKTLTAGSLTLGFNTLTGSWALADESTQQAPCADLPHLDGELFLDETTRTSYAQDYGQIVHRQPIAVLRPGSIEDIVRIVRFARRNDLQIVARGHAHQPFGQAQLKGGIVIDMRALHSVHAITDDRIEADAGIEWREILDAALSRGLTPPVLTNFLGLTVGGTLSIGGVGITTSRHGAQVDRTLALQVVTGQGDIVDCSATQHQDLFEAALAGQGQCAIITRATLRLERAASFVREYALAYPDLRSLVRDGVKLAQDDRFDGFVTLIVPSGERWSYLLTTIRYFTPPETPDDTALLSNLEFMRGMEKIRDTDYAEYADTTPPLDPSKAHADLGLCIPQSFVEFFLADALPRLTPSDLGAINAIRLFFWRQGLFTRPLMRLRSDRSFCYAAILRRETSDADELAGMLSGNRTLFEYNRDIGGTLYPFAALEMSRSDWRRHYGSAWQQLRSVKRRHDPQGIFASGPNLSANHRR